MIPATFPPPADAPHVKVCGMTRLEDARLAIELGAAFLGLVFAEESPRRVSRVQARALLAALRGEFGDERVRPVGVFVSEPAGEIAALAEELRLAAVQLHTVRPPEERRRIAVPILQAVRVRGEQSASDIAEAAARGAVLLDSFAEGKHGGTGKLFDHALAVAPIHAGATVFIAGGLKADNIGEIAARLREAAALPYAFDVSSGLEESPGHKSAAKMQAFFAALRQALE